MKKQALFKILISFAVASVISFNCIGACFAAQVTPEVPPQAPAVPVQAPAAQIPAVPAQVPATQTQEAPAQTPVADNTTVPTPTTVNGMILAGTCTTSLAGSSRNRINNVQVASSRLNGLTVAPGQAVSISTAILPRTAANGYKMAGVYSGGKTVQGMGGGICQVSSTVYNAVMNAGLTVTTRSPHSMPVHYLPLGQDAAISAGSKDMVFVNNYDTPITIYTACDSSSLTVSVFVNAQTMAGRSYRFYAKNTGKLSADSYRDIYLNGVLVGTELIAHSRYSAHQ